MLKVVIESTLLSLYHHYVEFNTRCSDEYKKIQKSLPTYWRNRPKTITDHFLMRKVAVDHAMRKSVVLINRTYYSVKRSDLTELKKKEYVVDFGKKMKYVLQKKYMFDKCKEISNNPLKSLKSPSSKRGHFAVSVTRFCI